MAEQVGDFLLRRLARWGIRRVYGYPGDGINGIIGALGRESEIAFTQVRHEEMAAFMACAHAKFTRQVGACLATTGPGAIPLLNGLYDARLDHQPAVTIVGQDQANGHRRRFSAGGRPGPAAWRAMVREERNRGRPESGRRHASSTA